MAESSSQRLNELRALPERWVVGLNVGTSRDGVDAALLRVRGFGLDVEFAVHGFRVLSLSRHVASAVEELHSLNPARVCRLHTEVAEVCATAVREVAREGGIAPGAVDVVGSHGLTLWHEPPRRGQGIGASLQLGNPAVLAERTGAVVVSDFRAADLAAGGHGAPLMPYLDYLLFRKRPGTLAVNLGGIANLCYVEGDPENLRAFDTGPCNLPLNELIRRLSKGESAYDADGRTAALGHVDQLLLDKLCTHPFICAKPPKSTGREQFGESWCEELIEANAHVKAIDLLATLTAFAARAVKIARDDWLANLPLHRVVVSGGGVKNLTLMKALEREFAPVPVESLQDHGFDPDAKEAILFALLANDRVFDRPTSLPSATGAKWPTMLGNLTY